MATRVAGELYESITGQLFEIARQLRQPHGYPFDPYELKAWLQMGIEGRFGTKAPTPATWTVDDEGNIRFTLTSNGMSREWWEQHLECRGFQIGDYARQALRRVSEAPTKEGTAHYIVVRPGESIDDIDRITQKIRAAAEKKGWVKPHWEVACLIRDTFTDVQLAQMGLWYIITMHEPINDFGCDPCLFNMHRKGGGGWFDATLGLPYSYWYGKGGFAFAIPHISSQA